MPHLLNTGGPMHPIIKTSISFVMVFISLRAPGKCEAPSKIIQQGLPLRDGFVEFMPEHDLTPLKRALPQVADSEVNEILQSEDTMWYDEDSMVFLYQDSIETVTGGRANCVGRDVGERNANNPAIAKLMNYFGPDYRFMFPFRTAAGTDNVTNSRVINFWAPPQKNGQTLPVRWWQLSSRGRWRWAFPKDTYFGEVLFQKAPDGQWIVFEIRTRKRYLDGWEVNVFRPFPTASSFASGIMKKRPDWAFNFELRKMIQHLENPATLIPNRWESKPYGKVFPPIQGALDPLPEISDWRTIAELLQETTFQSAEGAIWKEHGGLQTYAPASKSDFSLVPRGYEMGMIPVNEVSCNRCHQQTGRRLSTFEFDIILYGEVWGEDQIFTWHLFEPHKRIYGTWDDADGSRKLNSRMVQANLLQKGKPSSGDPIYKPLPTTFEPDRLK